MPKNEERKDGEGERVRKVSGYILFTQDYFNKKKKNKEECKRLKEETQSMKEAWDALKDEEKEAYRVRAKNLRSEAKGAKYVVPFLTRCAPNQFMKVCNSVKKRQDRMDRLKEVGFDKLVNVSCSQIPRDLCGQFMSAFDPPTNNVLIRGRALNIRREDVQQLMGLPCEGGH